MNIKFKLFSSICKSIVVFALIISISFLLGCSSSNSSNNGYTPQNNIGSSSNYQPQNNVDFSGDSLDDNSNISFGSNSNITEEDEEARQEAIEEKKAEIESDVHDIANNDNEYADPRLETELKYDQKDLENLEDN